MHFNYSQSGKIYAWGMKRLEELVQTGPELLLFYMLSILDSDEWERIALEKMREFKSYKWMDSWKDQVDILCVLHNCTNIPREKLKPFPKEWLEYQLKEWPLGIELRKLWIQKISDLRSIYMKLHSSEEQKLLRNLSPK